MLIWLLVNTILSVLALGFAHLNQGAPHRLRFHVCFIALLCWLVPWSQLPSLMSLSTFNFGLQLQSAEQQLINSTASATQIPLLVIDTRNVPLADDLTLLHVPLLVLGSLLLAGLVLFGCSVLQHQLRLQRLKQTARDGSSHWREAGIESTIPVFLQRDISGAFSSGVIKPVIWVHADLVTTPEFPTLLRHELAHIQQHDNAYLLGITLVEKLLWWNPVARYLGQQTRQLQELSCDERCRASNADYATDLAQLMLSNAGVNRSLAPEPLLLSANIFNKASLNIQRLKVLQRSHQMKPRNIVSAVATAVLAVATVGVVTAQPQPAPEKNVVIVRKVEGEAGNATFDVQTNSSANATDQAIGMAMVNSAGNQTLKMQRVNGNDSISFNFTDVPLPMVLAPLANMMNGPAAGMAPPDPAAGGPQRFIIKRQLPAGAPPAGVTGAAAMPSSPNLVIEDEGARTRQVTVSGENLSLADAIAKIAEASKCNIFKDGNNIVVDFCPAP